MKEFLVRSVDEALNKELCNFFKRFATTFEKLETSLSPIRRAIVLPDPEALRTTRRRQSSLSRAQKANGEEVGFKVLPSVESYHWVACALDVGYRRLSFVNYLPSVLCKKKLSVFFFFFLLGSSVSPLRDGLVIFAVCDYIYH